METVGPVACEEEEEDDFALFVSEVILMSGTAFGLFL
jgi:hypothetical protein